MKKIALALALGLSASAFASDHWDYCSSADGVVKLENGILTVEGIGEIAEESVKINQLSVVKHDKEMCVLQKSGQEVVAFENTVSVEEVTYTTEENDPETKVIVLCESGGSGIPAADSCKE